MDEMQAIVDSALFWDTDGSHIDMEKNARYIIERVISRGSFRDWKTVLRFYGREKVKAEVVQIARLDAKSLAYLSVFFHLDPAEFRCCN